MDVDYDDTESMYNNNNNNNPGNGPGGGNNGGDGSDPKTLQELVRFKNENEELNVYIILFYIQ